MLQKIGFLPGFNKQVTPTTAEGQWTGGDYVRFRYETPEKIGGWSQLGESKLTGVARALHHFINNASIKFAAIGTNRILYAYSGGVYYDIHPLVNPSGTAITSAFSTTNGQSDVTLTFSSAHNFQAGDIILFGDSSTFTSITDSNFTSATFCDKKFMVTSVPTNTTLKIDAGSNEGGTGATTSGGITYYRYYHVGPADQVGVYGYGISSWGGAVASPQTTLLNGALSANAYGTGGSGTTITVDSTTGFPSTGTNYIKVDNEEISYTGITSTTFTGITRNVRGTTNASHLDNATVTNYSDYSGWGQAAATTDKVGQPGLWTLDNYGSKLIALITDGACFEWDSDLTNAVDTRATVISGAPTASRDMLVSTPDRHLLFFGTETTIGDTTTQDPLFIRFSSQESLSDYTPTAVNTAGTQRLAGGSKIMGAIRGRNATYIWTDTSLFIMRFVGAPFTFAFEQSGTNCGLIGKQAATEVDGTAYWMSENGFFRYTGQLESMDCLVEDFVYDDLNTTSNQLINAGLNNLFGEVIWFYCTSTSNVVNRMVSYNYIDSSSQRGIWTTGSLNRTTWEDSSVFGKPHGTHYDAGADTSFDVTGNTEGTTIYYEHETGNNQIKGGVTTAIAANIESGDFDITRDQERGVSFRGDGEYIMKISRFIPDFLSQTGNTQITLNLRDYPNSSQASSSLGPFTIDSTTTKVDTRARARAVSLKVANTGVDQDWKVGTFRLDVQADGRR